MRVFGSAGSTGGRLRTGQAAVRRLRPGSGRIRRWRHARPDPARTHRLPTFRPRPVSPPARSRPPVASGAHGQSRGHRLPDVPRPPLRACLGGQAFHSSRTCRARHLPLDRRAVDSNHATSGRTGATLPCGALDRHTDPIDRPCPRGLGAPATGRTHGWDRPLRRSRPAAPIAAGRGSSRATALLSAGRALS